jgi:hypothetical protein
VQRTSARDLSVQQAVLDIKEDKITDELARIRRAHEGRAQDLRKDGSALRSKLSVTSQRANASEAREISLARALCQLRVRHEAGSGMAQADLEQQGEARRGLAHRLATCEDNYERTKQELATTVNRLQRRESELEEVKYRQKQLECKTSMQAREVKNLLQAVATLSVQREEALEDWRRAQQMRHRDWHEQEKKQDQENEQQQEQKQRRQKCRSRLKTPARSLVPNWSWQPNSPVVLDPGTGTAAGKKAATGGAASGGAGAQSGQATAAEAVDGVPDPPRATFLRFSDKCNIVHIPPSPPQRDLPPRGHPMSSGGSNGSGGGGSGGGSSSGSSSGSGSRNSSARVRGGGILSNSSSKRSPPRSPQQPTSSSSSPQPRFRCDSIDQALP